MSRSNYRFEGKTPFTDGKAFFGAYSAFASSGTFAYARNAKGDFSYNAGASQTGVIMMPLDGLIERLGLVPFLQEQFGTAAGVAGPSGVANTSDPDGGGSANSVPPILAANLPPRVGGVAGFVAKGIRIDAIELHYFIGTNPLSLHTVGLSKSVHPTPGTPAAVVVSDILANAANGLATAANALEQSTLIAITSPVFNVTDLSQLILEVDATTPAGGSYRFYGVTLHVSFNYN